MASCKVPRYDVMVNGQKVGQLWWARYGYYGHLPIPVGNILVDDLPLNDVRKLVSYLNRNYSMPYDDAVKLTTALSEGQSIDAIVGPPVRVRIAPPVPPSVPPRTRIRP